MACQVDKNKCIGCQSCIAMCPLGAIKIASDGKAEIDTTACMSCGTCASVCPMGAITAC